MKSGMTNGVQPQTAKLPLTRGQLRAARDVGDVIDPLSYVRYSDGMVNMRKRKLEKILF